MENRWRSYSPTKDVRADRGYRYLVSRSPALDVACGIGRFCAYDPKNTIGLDWTFESVQQVAREHGNAVVQGDATSLPFTSDSFEGVYCSDLIEHLDVCRAMELLRELGRVLRPGGRLVLSGPLYYDGFWNDFSHVRPYYPKPILRYLTTGGGSQRTGQEYPYRFQLKQVVWDYEPWFAGPLLGTERFYRFHAALKLLGLWAYSHHVHTWTRNGFTLVLDKTE